MSVPVFVSDEVVTRALTPDVLLRTVEETLAGLHHGNVLNPGKLSVSLDDEDGARSIHAMVGVLVAQRVAGVKCVGAYDRNSARGLPRAPATILLSDTVTGLPLAVVEATSLTARRTAAAAVVAAKHCLQQRPRRAAILGFGAIGKSLVPLLTSAFGLEGIAVWGGNGERLRENARQLEAEHAIAITVCDHPERAAADADIVFTASGLTEDKPFLARAMIADHAVVCAMGSCQEVAADIVHASQMRVVDDWDANTKRGSLAPVIRKDQLTRAFVHRELPELVATGGFAHQSEPVRNPFVAMLGLGALDVALAHKVLAP